MIVIDVLYVAVLPVPLLDAGKKVRPGSGQLHCRLNGGCCVQGHNCDDRVRECYNIGFHFLFSLRLQALIS